MDRRERSLPPHAADLSRLQQQQQSNDVDAPQPLFASVMLEEALMSLQALKECFNWTVPVGYVEQHVFSAREVAFFPAILPDGRFGIAGGRVMECSVNPVGIRYLVIRTNMMGIAFHHVPRWVCFHYATDARLHFSELYEDGDMRVLEWFSAPLATRDRMDRLTHRLVPEYIINRGPASLQELREIFMNTVRVPFSIFDLERECGNSVVGKVEQTSEYNNGEEENIGETGSVQEDAFSEPAEVDNVMYCEMIDKQALQPDRQQEENRGELLLQKATRAQRRRERCERKLAELLRKEQETVDALERELNDDEQGGKEKATPLTTSVDSCLDEKNVNPHRRREVRQLSPVPVQIKPRPITTRSMHNVMKNMKQKNKSPHSCESIDVYGSNVSNVCELEVLERSNQLSRDDYQKEKMMESKPGREPTFASPVDGKRNIKSTRGETNRTRSRTKSRFRAQQQRKEQKEDEYEDDQ